MITLQQSHDINGLNADTSDCNVCKAQTLADVMCDFNQTFETEENFVNPWQQSQSNDKNEFSNETEKSFRDKE